MILKYGKEKVIGVTGTKGKSTTSSLIYSILSEKYKVKLVGNIGLPAFDEMDEYDKLDYIVYELSSHQLEFVKHSPKYAVLLNMYEEHLDHYKDYDAYKEAKRNIFKYQSKEDYYIYNYDMKEIINEKKNLFQTTIGVGSSIEEKKDYCYYTDTFIAGNVVHNEFNMLVPKNNLKGKHNIYNMTIAIVMSKLLNVEDEKIIHAINNFKPLQHRLEEFGTYNGVTYINDSIATIPEAVISAVNSIENIDTVLIGGLDRGINYDKLVEFIQSGKIPNVILMYDTGKRIYNKLTESKINCNTNVINVNNLEEATKMAVQITKKGKICLLSPAAASYGTFKNFEERGDRFKELVRLYTNKQEL